MWTLYVTHTLCMHISDEVITRGTITATIQIGPFPAQQKYDLCKELLEVQQSCPVEKGPLNIGIKAKIPASAPKVQG